MSSLFGGGSKKKLQRLNTLTETTQREIAGQEHELEKVNAEITQIDADILKMTVDIRTEKANRETAEIENETLAKELEGLNIELNEIRRKLDASKAAAAKAKKEKEDLYAELARSETLVTQEHKDANVAADAAREVANKLRKDQEEQRRRWQNARAAHEELQRQVDAGMQEVTTAHTGFETAKREWSTTKSELQDLQAAHRRLADDHRAAERNLAEQHEKRAAFEADLRDLQEKTEHATAEYALLEQKYGERQKLLAAAKEDLDGKREVMNQELKIFERNFQESKDQRERLLCENDEARKDLSSFLPQYFKLQTEHAQKQREFEQVRRTHETLKWESHKVSRDLGMLTKSYDAGYLPSLSPRG